MSDHKFGSIWAAIVATTAIVTFTLCALAPVKAQQSGGLLPGAPKLIVCTTTCSAAGIKVGQTFAAIKIADTTRTSNATVSNDTDLTLTSVPVGRYKIDYSLQWNLGINAAAGGVQFGGTCTTCTSQIASVIQNGDGVNIAVNPTNGFNNAAAISAIPASTREALYNSSFTVSVTGTSTLAVLWAQGSSGTTGTILRAGSSLVVTRLQ